MSLIAFSFSLITALTGSSSLVAEDVIRAGDRVTISNSETASGTAASPDDPLLGREVKRTIYAGREITFDNTRPARLIKRNQVVTLKYLAGGLEISTTGRAMGEAGQDEEVTVLNLQSRQMVHGIVQENGWILVQ
ncbi:MAG: flagellar basal body P-ring formation chaperone FlgA [Henriciella sp.]|nr:flagellar basal body P-ring formation chaperone FlgA [Henriciella sp.]